MLFLDNVEKTHSTFLYFHCNSGYMNAAQCYTVCTLRFLLLPNFRYSWHAIACHVTPYKASQNAHKWLNIIEELDKNLTEKLPKCLPTSCMIVWVGKQWGRWSRWTWPWISAKYYQSLWYYETVELWFYTYSIIKHDEQSILNFQWTLIHLKPKTSTISLTPPNVSDTF